jgi:hypothetical protein
VSLCEENQATSISQGMTLIGGFPSRALPVECRHRMNLSRNRRHSTVTTSGWRSTSKATPTEPRSTRRRLGSTSRNSGHERLEELEGAEALECGLDPGARHGETSARGCCFLERIQSRLRIATKGVRAGRIVAGKGSSAPVRSRRSNASTARSGSAMPEAASPARIRASPMRWWSSMKMRLLRAWSTLCRNSSSRPNW